MNPGTLFCQGQGGDQGTRAFISNLYGAEIANADMTEYTMNSEAGVKGLETAQKWIQDGLLGNGVATTEAAISSCSRQAAPLLHFAGVPPRSL